MSMQSTGGSDVVHRVGDREYRFGRLTLAEYGELQQALASVHRGRINGWITALTRHGLQVEQIPALIRQLEHEPPYREVLGFIGSPLGMAEVLKIGARLKGWQLGGDGGVSLGELGRPDELAGLVTRVANLDTPAVDAENDGGELDPLAATSMTGTSPESRPTSPGSTA
jgi:hypothetical protein